MKWAAQVPLGPGFKKDYPEGNIPRAFIYTQGRCTKRRFKVMKKRSFMQIAQCSRYLCMSSWRATPIRHWMNPEYCFTQSLAEKYFGKHKSCATFENDHGDVYR
jgi:hypothetical protein